MIPKLTPSYALASIYLNYIEKVKQSPFSGDIETSYASRLAVATDNSVYQYLPQAVVYPTCSDDIRQLCRIASASIFEKIKLTPRGGGTGTNGQALTEGVVVDLSRYMHRLIELNVEQGWVKVECGIVKDQLNALLKPHGLFFSPELSTSNRATLGGMINTDASGQGSLVYGKTSNHVLGLKAILASGEELITEPVKLTKIEALSENIKPLYQQAKQACVEPRELIDQRFPKLNRFLTGYDLKHAYDGEAETLDLTRLLCGSEGSLAFVAEATLNLTPIPKYRSLITVKYDAFDSALRHAPSLVEAQALSVETIDAEVLNLARQDVVWHDVQELITDVPDQDMQGINIVEFAESDESLQQQKIEALIAQLSSGEVKAKGVIGYQVCHALASINAIYAMRKKAVGLLGNIEGRAKPVAFAEDTCVPPESLADYIQEFRALLDEKELAYGMFGHVDSGVLHVRPALDLCDPTQEELLRELSDKVVKLTAKYKGLMWGEHGKGFRSEYGPEFFGPELFSELRRIKTAFDPKNQINPGKICTPLNSTDTLLSVDGAKRGAYDRQIPIRVRDNFSSAMDCNGNGLCFDYNVDSPMCPSFKATGDRRFSPKGRAGLMREWLRQLAKSNVDPSKGSNGFADRWMPNLWLARVRNTVAKRHGEYDFNHEVYQAMQTCLACKACTTACPIKVDVPTFRSEFIHRYHSRYLRPIKDYFVAYVEYYAPLMAKAPSLFNAFMSPKWVQKLTETSIGMVNIPQLSVPALAQQIPEQLNTRYDFENLRRLSDEQKRNTVLLVQDPFTSYYEAELVADCIKLVDKLGVTPVLLPFKPNGKTQHIKGFLHKFGKTAQASSQFLIKIASLGIPMLGLEPALVLCYRDEYKQVLGEKADSFHVQLVQEWLVQRLAEHPLEIETFNNKQDWHLFGHCTEKSLKDDAQSQWQSVFEAFNQSLVPVSVGCCGMSGAFGHDAKQLATSKAIYELSWKKKLAELPVERCLATGYSCRSQVKRFEEYMLRHPLQALLQVFS